MRSMVLHIWTNWDPCAFATLGLFLNLKGTVPPSPIKNNILSQGLMSGLLGNETLLAVDTHSNAPQAPVFYVAHNHDRNLWPLGAVLS